MNVNEIKSKLAADLTIDELCFLIEEKRAAQYAGCYKKVGYLKCDMYDWEDQGELEKFPLTLEDTEQIRKSLKFVKILEKGTEFKLYKDSFIQEWITERVSGFSDDGFAEKWLENVKDIER